MTRTRLSTFADDVAFVGSHTPVTTLVGDGGSARVAIAPGYQGRVMTSTARGDAGRSYGYLHRAGILAGERQPHMTVLGGEDRFWLGPEGGQYALGVAPAPDLAAVAYESANTVTNTGPRPWVKETGAPSIWILGQFNPGPRTTVLIPFVPGSEDERGPIVNDAYFGAIPPDRLRIADGVIAFTADGAERGKIGVPRPRARSIAGSYDADRRVLTLVTFTLPDDATDYVNSMWEQQARPYGGDVVNAYNDGPLGPGQPPLGPFYEIETSSPAMPLAPGASLTHVHRTFHFEGSPVELDALARATLGTGLP